MASGPRPNLFILGTMKSGTTSLHAYLATHPEIFMCEPKEPWYFVKEINWGKGEEWYLSLFRGAKGEKIIGESSTDYTKLPRFQGVVQRIARFNPEARFVYIMRDPIQRTISHYWYSARMGLESREMLRAIREDAHYRDVSHYAMQLAPYLELFGRDRIYLMSYEEFLSDSLKAARDIFSWLGVDPSFTPPNIHTRMNVTPQKVEQGRSLDFLHRFRYSETWDRLAPAFPTQVRKLARWLATKDVDRKAQPVHQVTDFLRPIQLEQTEALSEMLNRRFPEWTTLYESNSHLR